MNYGEKSNVLVNEGEDWSTESIESSPSKTISGRFPSTFNLYSELSLKHHTFYLGGEKSQRLYALSLHSGLFGKAEIILHDGPERTDKPLATVKNDGIFSRHCIVNIPSFQNAKIGNVQEDLRFHYGLKATTCTFSVPIEHGASTYVENFEWRQSQGDEVKALSGWPVGLKLVRSEIATPSGKGGKNKDRAIGESSDGNEVVAVWAYQAKPSMSKLGKFQFLGSGATGELGDHWAITAVVSVLRLWEITYAAVIPVI
jgi:hypothetical protein